MTEQHEKDIDTCREIFVEQRHYWRSIIAGILVVLGMASGVIGYAMHLSASMVKFEEQMKSCESNLNSISYIQSDLNLVIENQKRILESLSAQVTKGKR